VDIPVHLVLEHINPISECKTHVYVKNEGRGPGLAESGQEAGGYRHG